MGTYMRYRNRTWLTLTLRLASHGTCPRDVPFHSYNSSYYFEPKSAFNVVENCTITVSGGRLLC